MNRAEKKAAAAERRRQYRLRWVELGKRVGFPMRTVITAVSNDAHDLIKQSPQLRSEIELALDEFVNLLAQATVAVLRENPPTP